MSDYVKKFQAVHGYLSGKAVPLCPYGEEAVSDCGNIFCRSYSSSVPSVFVKS